MANTPQAKKVTAGFNFNRIDQGVLQIILKIITLVILGLLFSLEGMAQGGYGNSYTTSFSGETVIDGVNYSYRTTLKYRLHDAGYGDSPSAIQLRFINTVVTEIRYQQYKASEVLSNMSFPISVDFEADFNGRVIISKGTKSAYHTFSKANVEDNMDGGVSNLGSSHDFGKRFENELKSIFGDAVTYNDVVPDVSGTLSDVSLPKAQRIARNEFRNRINEIEREKNQTPEPESNDEVIAEVPNSRDQEEVTETGNDNNESQNSQEVDSSTSEDYSTDETSEYDAYEQARIERENENRRRQEQIARRQEAARQENEMITSASAAQAGVLYAIGKLIYGNYGLIPDGNIYTGNNLFFGLEGGYRFTGSPNYFNSDDIDFGEELIHGYTATVDLNFRLNLFGYEAALFNFLELGIQPYTGFSVGLLPHGDTKANINFGGKYFGGFKSLKFEGGYENGIRNFNNSEWFSSTEIGFGKAVYNHHTFSYGLRLSFWENSRLARHHISLGVIRERIVPMEDDADGNSTSVQVRTQDSDLFQSSTFNSFQDFFDDLKYEGFYLEWQHEHHGRLFFKYFNNYPYTGVLATSGSPDEAQADGDAYFSMGFSRIFGGYMGNRGGGGGGRRPKDKKKKDNVGFVMYTYDQHSYAGFSFGGLKKNKVGLYFNLKGGSQELDEVEIDQSFSAGASGNEADTEINNAGESSNSLYNFTPTNNTRQGTVFAGSTGVTFKLLYPLFAYAGVRLDYRKQIEEVRQYDSFLREPFQLNDPYESAWYVNTDESGIKVQPEAGLMLKAFDFLILKYGLSNQNGLFSQFGIGFGF